MPATVCGWVPVVRVRTALFARFTQNAKSNRAKVLTGQPQTYNCIQHQKKSHLHTKYKFFFHRRNHSFWS